MEEFDIAREAAGQCSKSMWNDFKWQGKWVKNVQLNCKQYLTRSNAVWLCVLQRSTADSAFVRRFKHYAGTTVCDEWKNSFQNFADWYTRQLGYAEGWDIDKDVLTGRKHYSPDTCILLPRRVNLLFSPHHTALSLTHRPLLRKGITDRFCLSNGELIVGLPEARQRAWDIKADNINRLRQQYVPLGLPDLVFDKAIAAIEMP